MTHRYLYSPVVWKFLAEVVELVDALRSGRSGLYARGGSNPPFGMVGR